MVLKRELSCLRDKTQVTGQFMPCKVYYLLFVGLLILRDSCMEYQFIRDPISGFRVKISDEQALIGRWFNEELSHNEVRDLLAQCRNIKLLNMPLVRLG